MTRQPGSLVPTTVPFWAKPISAFGFFLSNDDCESLLTLTIPSTLALIRFDTSRTTASSQSQWQSFDCGYIVSRLSTVCYLTALLLRVLLMEQQVLFRYPPPVEQLFKPLSRHTHASKSLGLISCDCSCSNSSRCKRHSCPMISSSIASK